MKRVGFLLIAIGWCSSAAAEPASPSAADVAFFEKRVRPLLFERCYRCHSTQARKQKGGLLLDGRDAILKGGDSGPAVVPGKLDQSLLIQAVRYEKESLQMPPGGKLPAGETAVLEEWVRRGAPFPGQTVTTGPKKGIDLDAGRRFWSFQALKTQPLPEVKRRDWPGQRIDWFILVEQGERGLVPSAPADRRSLVRRVTFDLTGLPPTPEEVEAFVQDRTADAYERLVDRLLASPHHGERWARFWLDLARYCDVAEPWTESKGQPWLYRDWVVRAFNDDMPFDRFVQMQLAADLVPGARPEDRAALAFLGLSPNYWKELKLDKDVIKGVVAEEWEERIQAVTGTFLGLTVACARCHDHKFDPITTQDYYALAGVFASVRQGEVSLLPAELAGPVQQARTQVKAIEEQIKKLQAKKPMPPELTKQVEELNAQVAQVRKTTPHLDSPTAPGVEEAGLFVLADGPHRTKLEHRPGVAQDVAVQVRGSPSNLGPVVPRRFLAVLSPGSPRLFSQGSGRLELARAIVTEGAPLAARVVVNRVWRHHFGAGLVETPSDFGSQGARPSHPELLDDLAARFVQNGWSIRWLHREIVLSAAYRQSSAIGHAIPHSDGKSGWRPAPQQEIDAENRWLWRMNRRRLEVEAWRDAMLAATGTLNRVSGGPAQDLGDPKNVRRTVYGVVKRRELHDMLRLHDFPDPTAHSAARIPTTTPLQQLFTLNSPFMQQQSAALVARLKKDAPGNAEDRIQRAYLLLYGRPATQVQVRLAREFLAGANPDTPEGDRRWQQYAQVLLGSNEFLFVD